LQTLFAHAAQLAVFFVLGFVHIDVHVLAVETCNDLWYPGDDTVSFEERILFNEVFLLDGDVIIEARL